MIPYEIIPEGQLEQAIRERNEALTALNAYKDRDRAWIKDYAKLEACVAEMREVIADDIRTAYAVGVGEEYLTHKKHALSTDCGKGWRSPEDYTRLEAACAEMRKVVEASRHRLWSHSETGCTLWHQCESALSTDCGQPLLDRLEKYRKALEDIGERSGEKEIIFLSAAALK